MYTDRAEAKVQADALLNSAGGQALSIPMLGMGGSFDTSKWKITGDSVTDEEFQGVQAKRHVIDYTDTSGKPREIISYVYPISTYDAKQLYVTTIDPNYSINYFSRGGADKPHPAPELSATEYVRLVANGHL